MEAQVKGWQRHFLERAMIAGCQVANGFDIVPAVLDRSDLAAVADAPT
jgi:hypothetical protein